MTRLLAETLIKFSQIPKWHEENIGHRVNRSTCHRWRIRGCRGAKLETILIGGVRYSSVEALIRFFENTTFNAEGASSHSGEPKLRTRKELADAEAYMTDEGIIS